MPHCQSTTESECQQEQGRLEEMRQGQTKREEVGEGHGCTVHGWPGWRDT